MQVIYSHDHINDFIIRLDEGLILRVHKMIDRLEMHGHELRMPNAKPLGNGFFELRILGRKQIRIIYAFDNNTAVLLHIFIKRAWAIPGRELRHAKEVWKNYLA